ncbi:Phage late control gene D protein (GPD) [compost metagenome]
MERRGEERLSLNLPGNPEISAEKPLTLVGFREGIAGDWIIEQVTHTIDKSLGYSCGVEAVKLLTI